MIRKLIYLIVMASLLTFSSSADTVILQDTPNPGDTTTTVTTITTTSHTTDNLLSQDFTDGSWEGTNQDSRHGSGTIAGVGGEYVESTITQSDIGLTDAQIQRGFTSTLGADIWFWDGTQDQSVTMTQTYDDKLGNITTQNRVVDYDSSYFNTYTDTITVGPNLSTEGEATARFDFTHTNTTSHRAADLKLPTLTIDYTNVVTSSTTSVEYCYMKIPPTCPAQEEIAEVETILETFEEELEELYLDDIYIYEEDYFIPDTTIDFEYSFNDELFEDDFEIEDDYLTFDEFFFEEEYFEDDFYEEFELEEFIPETLAFEEFEEVAPFNELPPVEEIFFAETEVFEEEIFFAEETYIETFTDEAFIEEFEEMFEEMPIEEISMEMAEEMFEETFEEFMEEPEIVEDLVEEYIVEEEAMEEEPEVEVTMVEEVMEEPTDEVEEQPSSESIIADEPEETTDVAEQEEPLDETTPEEGTSDGDVGPGEEPEVAVEEPVEEEKPKVDLDIKIATIENAIKNKISNDMQRINLTLTVVNEIISREMISNQPDMSSYFNMNAALFDPRQLPSGDPSFFIQASLESYNKTIYVTQANLVATDPVIQYQIKLNEARSATDAAYIKLKGLLDARSN